MALIRVKDKFQITLPTSLRKRAKVAVGDFLDGDFENGKIVLSAKEIIDRAIDEGRRAISEGRSRSFDTAKEAVAYLHKISRKTSRK